MSSSRLPGIAVVAAAVWVATVGAQAPTDTTTRVSVATNGAQGNDHSRTWNRAISADGRFVAFTSFATNMVPGDTNGVWDVFVHDRDTGATTKVSVATDGTQANATCGFPAISADGRYVAFDSSASNLVPSDTNGTRDVFVHDRDTGATTRVSVASDGTQGNDESGIAAISADGRYIAFWSEASNLVPGDTNGEGDIFIRDRDTGATTRVSVASGGTQGDDYSSNPTMSGDGRYIAFTSGASNLVPEDTNGEADVFIHDRDTGATTRVSVASGGTQGNGGSYVPAVSGDGRYVAFYSEASNLVPGDTNNTKDVFVHDRDTGATTRVSVASNGRQGNYWSDSPAISGDGRYVGFVSSATNLVTGDTNHRPDAFIHDRDTGATTRVNVASSGAQAGRGSDEPAISSDGRSVAFSSDAGNLVPGDTNGKFDVFVRDPAWPLAVDGITPAQGGRSGGTAVTVTGKSFQKGAAVVLGGTAATAVIVVDASTITASTPAHAAGPVNVVVTNPDGGRVKLAGGFTYVPCGFALDPTSARIGLTGGFGTVAVTTTVADCAWTAQTSVPWIQVTAGARGTGNGTVTYTVAAKTGTATRSGIIRIAGKTFTVTQGS